MELLYPIYAFFCSNYTGNTSEEEEIFGRDSTGYLSGKIIILIEWNSILSYIELNIFPILNFEVSSFTKMLVRN